ncbi:MAG TPA: FAD-dependent oxidoreductase [Acidimicrobiales bacterium]|nr:FAD-dependent oxidoreductase [Acidimicrobiales bacterium]
MAERFEAVVVGAGPAGSAAALQLARAGRAVALVERGPYPGSKNMFGGVVYARVLDTLIPGWWEEAPVERWVTRRATVVMTPTQSLTVDFRTVDWGEPPYNGATAFRADFDRWLADQAVAAGAELICSTTVTGLERDSSGRVHGVRTDRPDGDIEASVVIACDGVNSFLAKEAGLYPERDAHFFTLGAKEVLALPRAEIDARFGLRDRQGADFEIIGCTGDIPGGGFLYTNCDSVAVGVVLQLPGLARSGRRPEDVIAGLKAHPSIAPLVDGGELKEYSAHLIPEGGWEMMPAMVGDGILVAGDAAALCLAAGIWLEGVNFAIGSGAAAGETAAEALAAGDTRAPALARYRRRLEESFVLADHRRLRRAPALVLSDRVQSRYPDLACNLVQSLFTVENPAPKPGLRRLLRQQASRSGVGLRHLALDGWRALRTFG